MDIEYGFESRISPWLEAGVCEPIEDEKEIKEYRNSDIKEIVDRKVIKKKDYSLWINVLPQSNVIKFWMEDESWVVIRPSGNEHKIKYYKNLWRR